MITLSSKDVLPEDGTRGTLVGRIFLPDAGGPAVVAIRDSGVFDVSTRFPTVSALAEENDPAAALRATKGERIGDLDALVARERSRQLVEITREGGRSDALLGAGSCSSEYKSGC